MYQTHHAIELGELNTKLFETPEAVITKITLFKEAIQQGNFPIHTHLIAQKIMEHWSVTIPVNI